MRKALVYRNDQLAGTLFENEQGYSFKYEEKYVRDKMPSVSLTLSLNSTPYQSMVLFPFFDGLIPEGWLLDIVQENWKLNERDRFGLLLACCKDCIGAVSIVAL